MHMFSGPENGIDRTGLDALGAADALVLADDRNPLDLLNAMLRVQGFRLDTQQIGQCLDGGFTTGRALVNAAAPSNGFCIGPATRIATLPALGLWQEGINLVSQWITFHLEPLSGKAQQAAEHNGQGQENQNGNENACPHKRLLLIQLPVKR